MYTCVWIYVCYLVCVCMFLSVCVQVCVYAHVRVSVSGCEVYGGQQIYHFGGRRDSHKTCCQGDGWGQGEQGRRGAEVCKMLSLDRDRDKRMGDGQRLLHTP